MNEEFIALFLVVFNTAGFLLCMVLGFVYMKRVWAAELLEQDELAAIELRAEHDARHAQGQDLPQVIKDFTPFAEVAEVSAIFKSLDAIAETASAEVQDAVARATRGARKASKIVLLASRSEHRASLVGPLVGRKGSSVGARLSAFVPISGGTTSKFDEVERFKALVSESEPQLDVQINSFCSQKGIIRTCDAVLAASSSGFEGVYKAVWYVFEGGPTPPIHCPPYLPTRVTTKESDRFDRGQRDQAICEGGPVARDGREGRAGSRESEADG